MAKEKKRRGLAVPEPEPPKHPARPQPIENPAGVLDADRPFWPAAHPANASGAPVAAPRTPGHAQEK